MSEAEFEWDPQKDEENQAKHGVSFVEAQWAFADPHRVIAEDVAHSSAETRYYCFGPGSPGHPDGTLHVPRRPHPHDRSRLLAKRKETL